MSLEKINRKYYEMNDNYLDLCERQDVFINNTTAQKKTTLLNCIKKFKKSLSEYETSIKNLWINEKYGGKKC